MPANKYALLRYRIIDNCLTNKYKPYPSKEELRQACEDHLYGSSGEAISESTIEKDLWAMRNETELGYEAPIAYHSGHRGYYYTNPDYTIKDIALRDEEVNSIHFAARILYQFKDIEPFSQFDKAIEKIMNKVSVAAPDKRGEDPRLIQFEAAPGDIGSEYLGTLLDAIRNRNVIKIRYQKFTADQPKDYDLHPLLLKEYRNRWYLIAFHTGRKKVQSFGLERIRLVQVLKESFTPPAHFDPEDYFSRSFGITAYEGAPESIVFEVTEVTARYLDTQPLHPSQRKIKSNGNRVQYQIEVLVGEELIMYFLSLGPNVHVLSPDSVKNRVVERLKEAVGLYK